MCASTKVLKYLHHVAFEIDGCVKRYKNVCLNIFTSCYCGCYTLHTCKYARVLICAAGVPSLAVHIRLPMWLLLRYVYSCFYVPNGESSDPSVV